MEVVIPILAAAGLMFAGRNDKNQNNDMLNRETMKHSKHAKDSKHTKEVKKEAFTNMGQGRINPQYLLPNTDEIVYQSYPGVSMSIKGNDNAYPSGSAVTDKYYNATLDKRILSKDTQFGNPYNTNNVVTNVNGANPASQSAVMSLTGKPINVDDFGHKNMVPYFGGTARGGTIDANIQESILDTYSGTGSQKICKEERAPLFAPQANMQYPNGAPDNSDFIKSRMNPGTRMSNVKPWEEVRVAPGLNQGFTSCGSNGFNSGMEARDMWVDRNVDQLRTTNNPKLTFSLENHEGPSYSWNVQQPPNAKTYGRVEKFLPDKFYLNTPDRWLTTTGLEKAQSGRPAELLKDQNRVCTTSEYFGTDSNINGTNQYAPEFYEPAKRTSNDLGNVESVSYNGRNDPTKMDHRGIGRMSTTNRATIKPKPFLGTMINGALKAVVAPILEAVRPSRKENVVGTIRPSGNVQNGVGSIGVAYNPADRAPTTIRETTENLLDFNHLNVAPLTDGTGYLVSDQQEVYTQRETTEPEYFGTTGGATNQGFVSNLAASNQHNNMNKFQKEYTPSGNLALFNSSENINIKRADRNNTTCPWNSGASAGSGLGGMPPSLKQFGELSKMPQYYHESINCERIQPNILDAFRKNPYTQSLHSYVFP